MSNETERLAREWAEKIKSVPVINYGIQANAAAEHILATIAPLTMADVDWDDIDDPGEQPGVTHCLRCHRNGEVLVDGLCGRCRNHDAVRRYKQRKQQAA